MQISVFLTYVGVIVLIFVIGKIFLWPIKMVLKLAANSLLGGLVIFLINTLGSGFGIMIPLNIISAVMVGTLGLPGTALLLILQIDY